MDKELTITLSYATLRHLQSYIKAFYSEEHLSDGEFKSKECIYCLDFLFKTSKVFKDNSLQIKLKTMHDEVRALKKRTDERSSRPKRERP